MSVDVLEDLLEIELFAAEIKRHPRTVRRWIDQPNGLPYTKLGNRILVHRQTARDWIMSGMKNVGPRKGTQRAAKVGARNNKRQKAA